MTTRRPLSALAVLAGTALALGACAPGTGTTSANPSSSSGAATISKDVAKAGEVTLTVWDVNVEGSGVTHQEALNKSFMDTYPNVKIKRVARTFSDIKKTLGLALNSPDAPDVVQANQGYPDMGAFVSGGLLRPLGDYASLYGWDTRYPKEQLALNSFSADGKTWQQGNLYGISQTGEIVGVFANTELLKKAGVNELPKNLTEFQSALAKVKENGILPISFGNSEGWPGLHLFGIVQDATLGGADAAKLITKQGGAFTDAGTVQAATTLQSWADKGYLTKDSAGVVPDAAGATFRKGGSAFYVSGTWSTPDVQKDLGAKGAFFALSKDGESSISTTGGIGLAFAMSNTTKNPDVAAAYIDWITNAAASEELLKTGQLPAVLPDGYTPAANEVVTTQVVEAWRKVVKEGGLVPYIDYTTAGFYDVGTAAIQELISKQATPQQFADKLQAEYTK